MCLNEIKQNVFIRRTRKRKLSESLKNPFYSVIQPISSQHVIEGPFNPIQLWEGLD